MAVEDAKVVEGSQEPLYSTLTVAATGTGCVLTGERVVGQSTTVVQGTHSVGSCTNCGNTS